MNSMNSMLNIFLSEIMYFRFSTTKEIKALKDLEKVII